MKQIQFANIAALAAIVALSGTAGVAHAQAPTAMAPPAATDSTDQTVYNWKDVPQNQEIPITRAVFDQGGYQLYDTTGETIVVPFVNQNLYVMKFGQTNAGMYFVNDGVTPTLYVPVGGYLENSAAQGAKWYPFAQNFAYTAPVYVGPAPNWNAYVNMGWYPGMTYYGGYWGARPYGAFGVRFSPMPGLTIGIGAGTYHSWGDYRTYYTANPTRRMVIRQTPVFAHYNVSFHGSAAFGGGAHVAFGGGHAFGGAKPVGTFDGVRHPNDGHPAGWGRGGDHRDGSDHGGWGHGGGGDHSGGDHRDGGGDHGPTVTPRPSVAGSAQNPIPHQPTRSLKEAS